MGLLSNIGNIFNDLFSLEIESDKEPYHKNIKNDKNAPSERLPVVYGATRLSGVRIAEFIRGNDNQYLYTVYALCHGKIKGLYSADFKGYTSSQQSTVKVGIGYGDPTQDLVTGLNQDGSDACDSQCLTLMSEIMTDAGEEERRVWDAVNGHLKGVAFAIVRLKGTDDVEENNGVTTRSEVTFVVEGKIVYDPRDDQYKHSSNPALCMLDYWTNPIYGKGVAYPDYFHVDTFTDAATFFEAGQEFETVSLDVMFTNAHRDSGYFEFRMPRDAADAAPYIEKLNTVEVGAQLTITFSGGASVTGTVLDTKWNRRFETRISTTSTFASFEVYLTNLVGNTNIPISNSPQQTSINGFIQNYTCNGAVDTSKFVDDNLRALATCFNGYPMIYQGKAMLLPDRAVAEEDYHPTIFNSDNITSPITAKLSNYEQRLNSIQARYTDAQGEYDEKTYTVSSELYLSRDSGRPNSRTINLPFTNHRGIIERILILELNKSRHKGLIEFSTLWDGLDVRVGQVIQVYDDDLSWGDLQAGEPRLLRVVRVGIPTIYNDVNLVCIPYDPADYDLGVINRALPKEFLIDPDSVRVLPPTNLQVNSSVPEKSATLKITWDAPDSALADSYNIFIREQGSVSTLDKYKQVRGTELYVNTPFVIGQNYTISVFTVNPKGVQGYEYATVDFMFNGIAEPTSISVSGVSSTKADFIANYPAANEEQVSLPHKWYISESNSFAGATLLEVTTNPISITFPKANTQYYVWCEPLTDQNVSSAYGPVTVTTLDGISSGIVDSDAIMDGTGWQVLPESGATDGATIVDDPANANEGDGALTGTFDANRVDNYFEADSIKANVIDVDDLYAQEATITGKLAVGVGRSATVTVEDSETPMLIVDDEGRELFSVSADPSKPSINYSGELGPNVIKSVGAFDFDLLDVMLPDLTGGTGGKAVYAGLPAAVSSGVVNGPVTIENSNDGKAMISVGVTDRKAFTSNKAGYRQAIKATYRVDIYFGSGQTLIHTEEITGTATLRKIGFGQSTFDPIWASEATINKSVFTVHDHGVTDGSDLDYYVEVTVLSGDSEDLKLSDFSVIQKVQGGQISSSVSWSAITNKPSTFPPSAHSHGDDYLGVNSTAQNSLLFDGKSTSDFVRVVDDINNLGDGVVYSGSISSFVFNYSSSSNVDHIWYDDSDNSFNFAADTTHGGPVNNSLVKAGGFVENGTTLESKYGQKAQENTWSDLNRFQGGVELSSGATAIKVGGPSEGIYGTPSSRSWFAPRNSANTDWNYQREFGFDLDLDQWYFENGIYSTGVIKSAYFRNKADGEETRIQATSANGTVVDHLRFIPDNVAYKSITRLDHKFQQYISFTESNLDNQSAFYMDVNVSGSQTVPSGQDNEFRAIYIDMDSSATGGDTSDEHRLRAVDVNLRATGDSDAIVAYQGYAEAQHSSGQVTELWSDVNQARLDMRSVSASVVSSGGAHNNVTVDTTAVGSFNHVYGSFNKVVMNAAGDAVTHNGWMTGVYAEVEINDNNGSTFNAENIAGVRIVMDSDIAITQNGYYGIYIDFQGIIPSDAYAIYSPDNVRSYLGGNLDVNGTLDVGGEINFKSGNGYLDANDGDLYLRSLTAGEHIHLQTRGASNTLHTGLTVVGDGVNVFTQLKCNSTEIARTETDGIKIQSTNKLKFSNNYLQLWHDSNNSRIESHAGHLYLRSINVDQHARLQATSSNGTFDAVRAIATSGNVYGQIEYNGAWKTKAVSDGIDVNGSVKATANGEFGDAIIGNGMILARSGVGTPSSSNQYSQIGFSLNDGYGNENIVVNHYAGRQTQDDSNMFRIEFNGDSSSNPSITFEMLAGNGTVAGTKYSLANTLKIFLDSGLYWDNKRFLDPQGNLYENNVAISESYLRMSDLTYGSDRAYAVAETVIGRFQQDMEAGTFDDYSQAFSDLAVGFADVVFGQFNTLVANQTNTNYLSARTIEATGRRQLITNFTATGHTDGWTGSWSELKEDTNFGGTDVITMKQTTSGDMVASSQEIEDINHDAIYEVTVTYYTSSSNGDVLLSMRARDKNLIEIPVQRYDIDRNTLPDSNSPRLTNNPHAVNQWETVRTYIIGANVDISSVPALENAQYYVKLPSEAVKFRMLLQNWNNAGTSTSVHWYNPSVREIGAGKIVADNIIVDDLSALEAKIGGWSINDEGIFTGTPRVISAGDGYTSDGISILKNGGIYAKNMFITAGGDIYAKAGQIAGWKIEESQWRSNSAVQQADGYTNQGILIKDSGEIRAKNFKLVSGGDAYFRGYIEATSGSIGGWNITANGIYHGTEKTSNGYSSDGITIHKDGGIYAENFYIHTNGNMYAKGGTIGAWTINSNGIYTGVQRSSNGYTSSGISLFKDGGIYAKNFALYTDGNVHARGGTIGGFTIDSTNIYTGGKSNNGNYAAAGHFYMNTNGEFRTPNFAVHSNGDAFFRGTVQIGGTDLTANNTLNENITNNEVKRGLSGSGVNILPLHLTEYSTTDSYGPVSLTRTNLEIYDATSTPLSGRYGKFLRHGATGSDAYAQFGTNKDIPCAPNKKWLVSAWVRHSAVANATVQVYMNFGTGTYKSMTGQTSSTVGEWTRVSGIIDATSIDSDTFRIRLDNDAGASGYLYWHELMIEEYLGDGTYTVPSNYHKPSDSVAKEHGSVGGWTIKDGYIYSGSSPKTSNGFDTNGITLASGGAIRSPKFRLDTDGHAEFAGDVIGATIKTSTSGQRVEMVDDQINFYTSEGYYRKLDLQNWESTGIPHLVHKVYTPFGFLTTDIFTDENDVAYSALQRTETNTVLLQRDSSGNVRQFIDIDGTNRSVILKSINNKDAVRTTSGGLIFCDTNGTDRSSLTMNTSGTFLFSDDINVSGEGTAVDWAATSDRTLKRDFKEIVNAREKVRTLWAGTFLRDDGRKGKRYGGTIAQDWERVLPEAVDVKEIKKFGLKKTVNTQAQIALLVAQAKEVDQEVIELKRLVKKQGKLIDKLLKAA